MIRKATSKDIESIVLMSREFWKHTQFNEPFDDSRARYHIELSLSHGLLLVLDDGGYVCGFIAAIKNFLLASKKALFAIELGYWINKDHRKGRQGIQLIKGLEGEAKNQGVKYLSMVSMIDSNDKHSSRIYEILGYELKEKTYTKVLL